MNLLRPGLIRSFWSLAAWVLIGGLWGVAGPVLAINPMMLNPPVQQTKPYTPQINPQNKQPGYQTPQESKPPTNDDRRDEQEPERQDQSVPKCHMQDNVLRCD